MPVVLGLIFQVIWKSIVALLASWKNMKAQLIMHFKMGTKKMIISLHCTLQCGKLRTVATLYFDKGNLTKCYSWYIFASFCPPYSPPRKSLKFNYLKTISSFLRLNTFDFGDPDRFKGERKSLRSALVCQNMLSRQKSNDNWTVLWPVVSNRFYISGHKNQTMIKVTL